MKYKLIIAYTVGFFSAVACHYIHLAANESYDGGYVPSGGCVMAPTREDERE